MSEEGADAVAQCWHPQQVVAGRRRGRVRDQLTANGDRAELPSASRTRRKAAPPRPEPAVTAVTMFCSELWQHTGHGQTPPVRVSSQIARFWGWCEVTTTLDCRYVTVTVSVEPVEHLKVLCSILISLDGENCINVSCYQFDYLT